MHIRSRRLATALTLALVSGGATIAVAGPAQAIPIGCSGFYHYWGVVPGRSVTAYYGLTCEPQNRPGYIVLQKDGVEVATGTGTATYTCSGTAENTFYAANVGSIEAACG